MGAGLGKPRVPYPNSRPTHRFGGLLCFGNTGAECPPGPGQTLLRPMAELGFLRADGVCKELKSMLYTSI